MLPILQIGPFALQTPGLILLVGLWAGLSLSESLAEKRKADSEGLGNLVFFSLIAALVGARLVYALRFPGAFIASPSSVISLNPGLLDAWGASASGLVAALVYGQRRKLPLWRSLDLLTPLFALLFTALALSNLASGQAYGMPTELPWALDLWGASRHPSQIYEALSAAAILAWLWRQRNVLLENEGQFFLTFLALSAGAAIFLWGFRADRALLAGLRTGQLAAWFVLAAALWLLRSRQTKISR